MPSTRNKTVSKRSSRKLHVEKPIGSGHSGAKPKSLDAIALLEGDHHEVEGYFAAYEKGQGSERKGRSGDNARAVRTGSI
jgi:hypothetical protein